MIPRVHQRGKRTIGLLHYLYGPGTHEEHTDPHLVASFDGHAPDPGRDRQATLVQLQRLLDQPVVALSPDRRPPRHVWHLSVRNAPGDRVLSDDEWSDIAHRMVAAAGIDPGNGEPGCRWAAVRHATDHIHIVATLAREDGRKPRLHRDAARVQAAARLLETELGLRRLLPGDGTAAKRPTSAERHKAERQGRERTAREELRETVRRALAGTGSEQEFFDRLAAAGLLIRTRIAPPATSSATRSPSRTTGTSTVNPSSSPAPPSPPTCPSPASGSASHPPHRQKQREKHGRRAVPAFRQAEPPGHGTRPPQPRGKPS